ncbi:DtxR family iron (metal) dependent repressor, partial [Actinomyces sp. S6-Spd3]
NPVPGEWELPEGLISLLDVHASLAEGESLIAELARLGEPVQSEVGALSALDDIKMRPGDEISITLNDGELMLSQNGKPAKGKGSVAVPQWAEPHIFVQVSNQ